MSELERPESGKRRSFSQRVGHGGELTFRVIAHDHGLIPTKVEDDFGTDFWCQVDLNHESRKSSSIATTAIGACVRATTSADSVVDLTPGDARHLLSSGTPMVFVLIHFTGGPRDSPAYYRLVDQQFIGEMQTFLKSGRGTMGVSPKQCHSIAGLRDAIDQMLEHGYGSRIQIAVAEAGVNTVLPNTKVQVRAGTDGQMTWVSTVDYFSIFECLDGDQERKLLHAAFGSEDHTAARIVELKLRPDVVEYVNSLPEPLIISGFSQEFATTLRVIVDEHNVTEPFTYRAIGTHAGYVHSAGISLIFSEARDRSGEMVHETELYADPDVALVLEDLGNTLDFFALLTGNAKVYREDHDPDSIAGFDIGQLFPALEMLAAMIESWRVCSELADWPGGSVALRDFADPEVINTLVGFAGILTGGQPPATSIVMRDFPADVEEADLVSRPTTIFLPVVGNLRHHSLILHLTVEGEELSHSGETVALKFNSLIGAECEARDRVEKSTQYPEIVATANVPTQCFSRKDLGTLPEGLNDIMMGWTAEPAAGS